MWFGSPSAKHPVCLHRHGRGLTSCKSNFFFSSFINCLSSIILCIKIWVRFGFGFFGSASKFPPFFIILELVSSIFELDPSVRTSTTRFCRSFSSAFKAHDAWSDEWLAWKALLLSFSSISLLHVESIVESAESEFDGDENCLPRPREVKRLFEMPCANRIMSESFETITAALLS